MNKKAFIPISALMGALLLALVAAMTPFVAEPNIAYAQQSANADLATLAVVGAPSGTVYTGGDLAPASPDFATVSEFTVRTIFDDGGVTVTATAADTGATVRINGQTPNASNQVGVTIPAGSTTNISIVVRAAAGNSKTYTVKAYRNRSTLSDNANFSSLSISPSGGLKQSSTSTSAAPVYEARVQAGKVTVSYNLSDTGGAASAVVAAGSGTSIDDTTKPREVTLTNQGAIGTFTVTVTPESGTTNNKTYTINVYRIRDNRDTRATLSALTLIDQASNDALGGNFDTTGATTMYDLTVANTVEYVTVAPTATDSTGGATYVISPPDARPDTGHQVNLVAGIDTTITIAVTAEDTSSKQTYTVMIYKRRAAGATNPDIDDVTLRSLGLSVGTLTPAFKSGTTAYSAQVADGVEKVTVSYTPTNNLGGVTVARTVATRSGDTSTITPSIDLDKNEVTLGDAGTTTEITLAITSEDGDVTTDATAGNDVPDHYTIAIYRLRPIASASATLSVLSINTDSTTNVDGFTTNTLSASAHRMRVPFSTTSVPVTATPTQANLGATAVISPASPVALTAGEETEITVTVTAENRTTTAEYTVIVYRARQNQATDATLSALSLTDPDDNAIMLSPDFMSDRMAYTARVGNSVSAVTVGSTPTDDAGGVAVTVTDGTANPATAGTACPTTGVGDEVTLGSVGDNTLIHVCVTPENQAAANTKVYAITVYRERTNLNADATLSAFAISDVNPAAGITPAAVNGVALACGPSTGRVACNLRENSMPIVDYRVRTVSIDTTANDQVGAVVEVVSPADKNPATARHDIDLPAGAVTDIEVMVTAEDTSVTKTYTASVYRRALSPSKDATLSSLMLSGVSLMYEDDNDMEMTGFMSDVMTYTGDAGSRFVTVTAMANHIAAQRGITITPGDADASMDGWQVDIGDTIDAETTVTVQVRPESLHAATITDATDCSPETGSTTHADLECYTVTVTRTEDQAPRDEAALTAMYDTNGTAGIQIDEAVQAVQDYAAGTLTIEEIVIIVGLYATGG